MDSRESIDRVEHDDLHDNEASDDGVCESEISEILGPSTGYPDLLDYALAERLKQENEDQKNHKIERFPLRPSAAGFCARKLYYDHQEFIGKKPYSKEPITPQLHRIFELGRFIEDHSLQNFKALAVFEQRYLQQTLEFFDVTDHIKAKRRIEGAPDFVLWHEKYKAIGDVKSKKDKFSKIFLTQWDEELERFHDFDSLTSISDKAFWAGDLMELIDELGNDYLTDNLYQLNMYANADFILSRGVDHAFIYRYNKNDSRHMEIRFKPSKEAYEYVKKKFKSIAEGEVPEKEFRLGSIRCAFCDQKESCWGDKNTLSEYFSTLPPKQWPVRVDGELAKDLGTLDDLRKSDAKDAIEQNICDEMQRRKIKKVELPDGRVFQMRYYKSKIPPLRIIRSKK